MNPRTLLVIVTLCSIQVITTNTKNLARLQGHPLSKTRCDLVCTDVSKDTKAQCRSKCRALEWKPGTCPSEDNSKWAAACVETCSRDSHCDGTQKCCRHGCSSTCNEPIDLITLSGLPPVPVMEEVRENKRSAVVRWSDGVGDLARNVPGQVLYLLEEQHHLGPKYEEPRLGEWTLLIRTNRTKVSLRNLLKAGRWYRFRVAAVNASGTRGFSPPSAPFTPRRGPRPPPSPKNLKVHPVRSVNGAVTIKLHWREPRSDLPIVRYKVYWSRRVRGLSGELDSVLVNHQTVPKDQNFIEISDLKPNSMYFLQVQTISQFGLGKLRSDKAAIFYNTTDVHDIPPESLRKHNILVQGLKLNKIIWNDGKLKARISWEPIPDQNRYIVEWKGSQCDDNQRMLKNLSATTQQTTFEIYELDYNCSYRISVQKSLKSKVPDSTGITIRIPGCSYFQKKIKKTLNCGT